MGQLSDAAATYISLTLMQLTIQADHPTDEDADYLKTLFLFLCLPVLSASKTWFYHHLLVHNCYNIIQVLLLLGHDILLLHSSKRWPINFFHWHFAVCKSECFFVFCFFFWPFLPAVLCTQLHRHKLNLWESTDGWVTVRVSYARNHILYTCSLLKLQKWKKNLKVV